MREQPVVVVVAVAVVAVGLEYPSVSIDSGTYRLLGCIRLSSSLVAKVRSRGAAARDKRYSRE